MSIPPATSTLKPPVVLPIEPLWRRLIKHPPMLMGLFFLIFITIACFVGPWVYPVSPTETRLHLGASSPSWEHPLGTDTLGRDLLARVLQGGRISLLVGILATVVSLLIGVTVGLAAGYSGRKLDRALMRFVDILYSLPFTLFVILLTVVFGHALWLIFIAIGAVEWLTMARIVRGQALALRVQQFVDAARALGAGHTRILVKHLLPNLLGTVAVYATLTVPGVMLLEAFISFLGLGVQAPQTSWGLLIKEGAESMEEYPWLLIFPGLCFSLTLFALNFIGDGLRDRLDPRNSR